MTILQTPNTEPYGDIIDAHLMWNTKPVMRWDNYIKTEVWDHEETDKTHYVEYINGHFKTIPVGNCRLCEKEIKPYKTKYYQAHSDAGIHYCFRFDAEHYYCEECAQKEASKYYFDNLIPPRELRRFETMRDDELVEVREYEDGSLIENMTLKERTIEM